MQNESLLWYEQPAGKWTEALPIGNGRLGAMAFGQTLSERIQLNEESIWSGGFRNRNNKNAKESLPKIRSLLRKKNIPEAEELCRYALTGTPEYQRTYQTLGDLHLSFKDIGEISNYKRSLSLNDAITYTQFSADGYNYSREAFASYPADIIAVKLSTDHPDGLNFDARLIRYRFCENSGTLDANTIFLNGANGGTDGITFSCVLSAGVIGGEITAIGEYLIFRQVKEAILYITAVTSIKAKDPLTACKTIINKAEEKDYHSIKTDHLNDYRALESRVSLNLYDEKSHIATDKRMDLTRRGFTDNGLIALYFRYGRYLLISSSRPGSLPANLQGIWCDEFLPAWDSKFTININAQMNYWPAEICSLPECHEPLIDHIRKMHPNGIKTAQEMYGARGFVAHHNTDIWGDTAPQDTWAPSSYWVLGAAWLCLHIWEHYEYTKDEEFLLKNFDLLKDACLFFIDFLIENEQGDLVISPSVSPENTYILPDKKIATLCEGCTMDGQILTELFKACEEACHILKKDPEFANQIAALCTKLPQTQVGKNGGIMEWLEEKEEAEPGHRHMSHLFALFPGNGISPEETPLLAKAAKTTLRQRLKYGGGHTGWSRAWIINFWAKLGEAKETYNHLYELLRHSTLPNLFDDHPPFQIDGNFGATAAIAHMLLQSTHDTIYLLKSLPEEWKKGQVKGLCAKGGITADITWSEGKLTEAYLYAAHDYSGRIIYNGKEKNIKLKKGDTYTLVTSAP